MKVGIFNEEIREARPDPLYIPKERIEKLALPKGNTAQVESEIRLTKDKVLLEGRVKSQVGNLDFHPNAYGGGEQVFTDPFSGGVERVK